MILDVVMEYRHHTIYRLPDGKLYVPAATAVKLFQTVAGAKRAVDRSIQRQRKYETEA